MAQFPKIRIYRLKRNLKTLELTWWHYGSTTQFPTKEAAVEAYTVINGTNHIGLRAEFAATHGYFIE